MSGSPTICVAPEEHYCYNKTLAEGPVKVHRSSWCELGGWVGKLGRWATVSAGLDSKSP